MMFGSASGIAAWVGRGAIAAGALAGAFAAGTVYGGHRAAGPRSAGMPVVQGWTGALAVPGASEAGAAAPMSSASLVVPKEQLALPSMPAKPILVLKDACDSADTTCAVRPLVRMATPRQVAALDQQALNPKPAAAAARQVVIKAPEPPRKSGATGLNPLDHLPSMADVGRPFAAARDTVTGWVKWF